MSANLLTDKQQFWLKHLNDYESFTGSQKEYAQTHNLKLTDLYSGRKILRKKGLIPELLQSTSSPKFSRVMLNPAAVGSPSIELRTPKVSMTFRQLPDPQWLANVLKALDHPS